MKELHSSRKRADMNTTESGQLYTIEGLAAALIMLLTAYMVVNATSVYTAGDTHISDMQLEQMGSDALNMLGTPANQTEHALGNSTLRSILEDTYTEQERDYVFETNFLDLVNTSGAGPAKDIQFVANYTCRDDTNPNPSDAISADQRISSSSHILTGTEHPVRVTKWVVVNTDCGAEPARPRAVLVEVLLWLD